MKLPMPALAMVISRNNGVRFGLLTADMQGPWITGIYSGYLLKMSFRRCI